MTIVKNQHQAEEITQNTFYKAMTARRHMPANQANRPGFAA